MVVGAVLLVRAAPWATVIALLGLVGWTQIGAPHYDPSSYTPINASPLYDQLFRRAGDQSETVFHETVWFEEQMDRIANDASASFVTAGGWSRAIVAVYAPHVVGRLVEVDDDRSNLADQSIADIKGGARPVLAVFGPPADVARLIATFPDDLGVGTVLLDVTHDSALGYRLVVFSMPDAATAAVHVAGRRAPDRQRSGGRHERHCVAGRRDRVRHVRPVHHDCGPAGTPRHSSIRRPRRPRLWSGCSTSPHRPPIGVERHAFGTSGRTVPVSITFDVSDPTHRYEFRTQWNGEGSLTVVAVTSRSSRDPPTMTPLCASFPPPRRRHS